jgi:hypothetical protein
VRLPTQQLIVRLDFPAELEPSAWGMETSMSAEALPFHTPISRTDDYKRTQFSWATDDPPLHARYRLEWRFKRRPAHQLDSFSATPSQTMAKLGVIQRDDPLLRQQARPFALPEEAEDARRVVADLGHREGQLMRVGVVQVECSDDLRAQPHGQGVHGAEPGLGCRRREARPPVVGNSQIGVGDGLAGVVAVQTGAVVVLQLE